LHKQPHRHRSGVPPTGNKSFENRPLRTPAAEMEHLRIKLVSEFDELFLCHAQRVRFEAITDFQILEISLLHNENENTLMPRRR
jgi:hypothetical protein